MAIISYMQCKLLATKNSLLKILLELALYYRYSSTEKDKNIWVFGAIRGQKYMDNARYLFEYINKNSSIEAIWISKNADVVKALHVRGYSAYLESSKEAKVYASRASVAVITHRGNRDKSDLPYYAFNAKTHIIQLWHGIALKKIGYDDTIFSFRHNENSLLYQLKRRVIETFFPYFNYVNRPSLVVALSNESKRVFASAFRVDSNSVEILGYPRNDRLLTSLHVKKKVSKKIIYMPTFRGEDSSAFNPLEGFGFDVKKIDTFLKKEDIHLHVKLHPFNLPTHSMLDAIKKSSNILILEDDSIYDTLAEYDMLLTDYSSVYFDYLLLDRPIIFTPFDSTLYQQDEREFYYDYSEVTPGYHAYNWDEVMEKIIRYSANASLYAKERKIIKDRFHTYQDTHSSERIYNAIKKCIG